MLRDLAMRMRPPGEMRAGHRDYASSTLSAHDNDRDLEYVMVTAVVG